ncbi:hypothetical protein CDAR_20561 [Caerostris darwini]|uniref:Uncharacterized protein n=1 Tax=Caerostris darwini TaxID=1538125 RepID=A0AAV4QCZ3_9ARAC|nr:hypothetical protein CDAR_20561 [Caerostris darwini]
MQGLANSGSYRPIKNIRFHQYTMVIDFNKQRRADPKIIFYEVNNRKVKREEKATDRFFCFHFVWWPQIYLIRYLPHRYLSETISTTYCGSTLCYCKKLMGNRYDGF